MPVEAIIRNGGGDSYSAKVTKDRSIVVVSQTFPTLDPQLVRPFRQYLTDDGTIDGSFDLGVNGSVNAVDFFIEADENDDRYISRLSFILGYGSSAPLYVFADGVALTNGVRIFYTSQQGENEISLLKVNYDLLRIRDEPLTVGWETRNFNALNDYGYIGRIDLARLIPPYGIKLDRGTRQRLTCRIQDDISGVADLFDIVASGFDRFEL